MRIPPIVISPSTPFASRRPIAVGLRVGQPPIIAGRLSTAIRLGCQDVCALNQELCQLAAGQHAIEYLNT